MRAVRGHVRKIPAVCMLERRKRWKPYVTTLYPERKQLKLHEVKYRGVIAPGCQVRNRRTGEFVDVGGARTSWEESDVIFLVLSVGAPTSRKMRMILLFVPGDPYFVRKGGWYYISFERGSPYLERRIGCYYLLLKIITILPALNGWTKRALPSERVAGTQELFLPAE